MKTYKTNNAAQTIALGEKLGSFLQAGDILALEGTLAAGKTTFTKGIARALEIEEDITSPTFTVISEYYGKMPLYHFDAYRLSGADDFINLGCDDMLYGRGVCVIEWSEKIREELPPKTITIRLEAQGENRLIEITNWPYGDIT